MQLSITEFEKKEESVISVDWAIRKPIIAFNGRETKTYETIDEFKNIVSTTILCETGIPRSLFTIEKPLKIVSGNLVKQKREELNLEKTDENDAKVIYWLYEEKPDLFKLVEQRDVGLELLKKKVKTYMRYEKVKNSIQNMNQGLLREYGEFEDIGKISSIVKICEERSEKLKVDIEKILKAHFYKETKGLTKIKGISFILVAKLLSYTRGFRSHTLDELKSFAGISPHKGKQKIRDNKYSRTLQMILLGKKQIVDELIIFRVEPYRRIYDGYKERLTKERPDETKGYIDNMARRKVADKFLADFLKICRKDNLEYQKFSNNYKDKI